MRPCIPIHPTVIITSALLIFAAGLLASAHPVYIQRTTGPYWNECFFQDLDESITFSQLTLTTFILLGITQILWGRIQQKIQSFTQHPKLSRIAGTIQTLSGIIFLAYTISLFIIPINNSFFYPLPLSLLFLLAQTLSTTTFLYSNTKTPKPK